MNKQNLEAVVATMVAALRDISRSHDCDYIDQRDKPIPCPCSVCTAKYALTATENWRFIGAKSSRMLHNPREAKVIDAWSKLMDDHKLSQILDEEGRTPAPRDWYVASSIIQWLTTNVGSSVLEAAGWKYEQYDKDREWIREGDKARDARESHAVCAICHHADRTRCGHWVGHL